jgi:hypothetical protein
LHREPDIALLIENQGVRIPGCRVGHRVLGDLPGRRIQLADVPVAVARVPDHVLFVHDQVVRKSAIFQLVAPELARLRIEIGHIVADLAHEPDPVLAVHVGVTGAGAGVGNRPFLDRNLSDERVSKTDAQPRKGECC